MITLSIGGDWPVRNWRAACVSPLRERAFMRVEVFGEDTISSQARAYAEYRVFAALTQALNADACSGARVALRSVHAGRGHDRIACTVTVASDGSDILRVRATGEHACAAIDRAVECIVARGAEAWRHPG